MSDSNLIALEVASLVSAIKKSEETLAAAKTRLIILVGDGGSKFETALGVVTVTQQTLDRRTGTFSYALNLDGFNTLDERVQANLLKQNVVTKTEKVTKGTAPMVKVTLK